MSGPNYVYDCEDMRGTPEVDKLASKIAIGWMRRLRARIATDIIGFCGPIGGDRSVPIDHEIAEAIRNDTIELIADHVWEIPLFDFVADKEVAEEHEPQYSRLRFALESIEEEAQKRRESPYQQLMDIKAIAGAALAGCNLKESPFSDAL